MLKKFKMPHFKASLAHSSHRNGSTGSLALELGQMETSLRAKRFTYETLASVHFSKDKSLIFFYKVTPPVSNTEALAHFDTSLEKYATHFWQTDDWLTDPQRAAAVENYPDGDVYGQYLRSKREVTQSDRR